MAHNSDTSETVSINFCGLTEADYKFSSICMQLDQETTHFPLKDPFSHWSVPGKQLELLA